MGPGAESQAPSCDSIPSTSSHESCIHGSSPVTSPKAAAAGKELLIASGHNSIMGKRKSGSVVLQDFSTDAILVLKIRKRDKERGK